jgi:subtilase family serine protease
MIFSAVLAAIITAAPAVQAQAVQLSGHTFHKASCPGPAGPRTAHCHAHVVTDRAGNILANLDRGGRPLARGGTPSGFGPPALRAAYGVNSPGSSSTLVAIVDAYGYSAAESNLTVYRSQFGLPACTSATHCFTKVNQNGVAGSYPKSDTGWDQEQALDLAMVSAMCPNCRILLVEANSANFQDLEAAENRAAAMGATVISNSYGGSETGTTQADELAYTHSNAVVTVSTGDSGYGVQFPASLPEVIATGGTSLTMSGLSRVSETAWSGAGSGCSAIYLKPTWQSDTLCKYRMEADISAVADPNTGVAVYAPVFGPFSGWLVFGGTSVAAPLIGGIYAANGVPANPGGSLYPALGANPWPYNDVTSGNNGSCGGTYFCTAGPGYDGPTGLGTPKSATGF